MEEKPINQVGSIEEDNELTGLNHEISSQNIMEVQENYMKSPSYVPDGQIHFGKQNSQFEIAPIQVDDVSEFNSQSRPVSGAINQANENARE